MLQRELKDELPWLQRIKEQSEEQLLKASLVARVRFRWLFTFSVDKYLPKKDSTETETGPARDEGK
jgi:hypothetical protein